MILENRHQLIFLICLAGLVFCKPAISTYGQPYELATRDARLIIDKAGNLTITSRVSPEIVVKSALKNLLRLSLKRQKEGNNPGANTYDFEPGHAVDIYHDKNQITLSYDKLKKGDVVVAVTAKFRIFIRDEAFVFSASLWLSSKEWLFKDLTYPILSTVQVKNNDASIYWPTGLGQRFDDPVSFGNKGFDYPSGKGSMQWFTINTDRSGFYFACHDGSRSKKQFNLSYVNEVGGFNSSVSFPIYQNHFQSPDVMVHLYQGKWHEGAKRYRTWYDTQFKIPEIPDWVKKDAGCVVAVLKQQNGLVMWRYNDLDKLCDAAAKMNMRTIRLLGWAKGGYDHLYPNYIPDDLLGGRNALAEAIERAHNRGFRIILHVDGALIGTETDYYLYNGNSAIALDEDKLPYIRSVRRYNSSAPAIFAEASYSAKVWRKTMQDVAIQAHELGADGIWYGQVGSKEALLNFSKIQDHSLPQEAGTKYRYQMLNEIRTTLKNLSPHFALMTDGVNDAILTDIDYYQERGDGSYPSVDTFPGLFKYTFPELVSTQRHSSPALPRYVANLALLTGQRHEIESLWEADADYLLQDKLINSRSYPDEVSASPDPEMVKEMAAGLTTRYLYNLIKFENRYAEFFREGKYTDTEGFSHQGKDIMASGFQNGKRLGIVVCNQNRSEGRNFEMHVPGYRMVEATEPETNVAPKEEMLKANSIRLLIYEKK